MKANRPKGVGQRGKGRGLGWPQCKWGLNKREMERMSMRRKDRHGQGGSGRPQYKWGPNKKDMVR